jgi:hypothetical protein
MVKLWLDDERDPDEPFIREEFGSQEDMLWVKTAPAAISRLVDGNVEYISLDHDLGAAKAGTGADVARWIEEQAFNGTLPRLAWSCHSKNAVGKKYIVAAMRNAERYWDQNDGP